MGIVDKIKELLDYDEDIDLEDEEFEELEEEEKESVAEPQKVVAAAAAPVAMAAKPRAFVPAGTGTMQRPKLTVHTTKVPELAMEIHVPSNFEQVARIADDLLANRATIVNFERVETTEQQRIFDFINGVSYVLDCAARRVSPVMMLYVPSGVDVATALPRPMAK
ncbi:MAG: cell division protein SepF [Schwartzia sp.]|nr:cell division protein SepF [Schwartzia sp. (in: firmicutes)]MBR1884797.1 cell division protein SepF [Schwartzia sp. (in: firmicutes)]